LIDIDGKLGCRTPSRLWSQKQRPQAWNSLMPERLKA
jgi:hypothetical protein